MDKNFFVSIGQSKCSSYSYYRTVQSICTREKIPYPYVKFIRVPCSFLSIYFIFIDVIEPIDLRDVFTNIYLFVKIIFV